MVFALNIVENALRHGDARVLAGEAWRGPDDFDAEMERLVKGRAG